MKNKYFYFSLILILSSCDFNKRPTQSTKNIDSIQNDTIKIANISHIDQIQFLYTIVPIKDDNNVFEIQANLLNTSSDSVYFLSTSCFGEQWSLRYDTSMINYWPKVCNVSNPIKYVIPPKGKHKFKGQFQLIKLNEYVQFGFDFYEVDQTFQFSKKGNDLNIFNRPKEQQTIILGKKITTK